MPRTEINPVPREPDVERRKAQGIGFSEYLGRARIPNLDGLRGIAILLVLAHHVPLAATPWLAQFQHSGKHGVSLFFVISGYIVMTLMLRELRRAGSVDVRGFLWRRILRLWPLYYAVLLAEGILVFVLNAYSPENQALFADKLSCYVLYCSNWLETSGQGPFFVSWSLAVEEQFYLLLAIGIWLLRPGWLVTAVATMLFVKVLLVHGPSAVSLGVLPWRVLLSYSEAILLGVLLAFFLNGVTRFAWFAQVASVRLVPVFLLGLIGGVLLLADVEEKSNLTSLMLYVLFAVLVGICAVSPRLPVIGDALLSRIGTLSYGIYLFHMPVLSAMKKMTGAPAIVMAGTIAIVVPMAWLSFNFFEEPIRKLGRPGRGPASRDATREAGSSGARTRRWVRSGVVRREPGTPKLARSLQRTFGRSG